MSLISVAGGLSLLLGALVSSQSAATIEGNWIGSIRTADSSIPIRVFFLQDAGALKGTIDIVSEGIRSALLAVKVPDADQVQFSLQTEAGNFDFRGKVKDGNITGDAHVGNQSGTFQMVRLVPADPVQNEQYFGIYQVDPNRYLYIRTWDELGKDQLTYFDSSGEAGSLYPMSSTSFFSGPGILNPFPEKMRIRFATTGKERELLLVETNLPEKSAKKMNIHKEEEVHFRSGNALLAGTLFTPNSTGPHPAIVLIHGSGPVSRDFMGPIAYHFVRNGIAVLAYDKRGIGKSEGNWMEVGFEQMAKDAVAGVEFLKTRREMDPQKIGLWGISQGGWIAPLAASLSKDVAFVILVSAASVTPEEQQIQATEAELRIQEMPEEKIEKTVQATRAQFDLLRSEETQAELEVEVKKLTEQGDVELLAKSGLQNPLFLLFYRRILDYDPIPVLEKTKCPALIIYGGLDATVPRKDNQDRMEAALKRAGNSNYKVLVFPHGNHALLESQTGSNSEFPFLSRFVPDFFDSMSNWIHALYELQASEKSL